MLQVESADYRGAYRIHLKFSDGTSGIVDLQNALEGPVFRPLQDLEAFRQFKLEGHTLAWENGADMAPEYLRSLVLSTSPHAHAEPTDIPS